RADPLLLVPVRAARQVLVPALVAGAGALPAAHAAEARALGAAADRVGRGGARAVRAAPRPRPDGGALPGRAHHLRARGRAAEVDPGGAGVPCGGAALLTGARNLFTTK